MAKELSSKQEKKKRGVKPGTVNNPEGKGGFQDHPELRSDGRWSKDNSFSYWMNFFKAMSVEDFFAYEDKKPENERTVAESLAYARVSKARDELREFQEVANRTEGMPKQTIESTNKHSIDKLMDLTQEELDERIKKLNSILKGSERRDHQNANGADDKKVE